MKICVIGLGLIGGSMAKAINETRDHEAVGYDIDQTICAKAIETGAITAIAAKETLSSCGMIILALWPHACIKFITDYGRFIKKGTIVIDCCGIKTYICQNMKKLSREFGFTFIGGHPMAGKARVGFDYSSGGLFQEASMILTPDDTILPETRKQVGDFFLSLGFGKITLTTPEEHDRIIAFTSQMCHILSNTYIKSPTALTHEGFSAGSFQDLTRVAWLNETMWSELFIENRKPLLSEIDIMIENLKAVRKALDLEDEKKLQQILRDGRLIKEELNHREQQQSIRMNNAYDVFIAPGLLAEIGKQSKQVICGNTIAIITDDIVASFYGKETIHSLESAGFSVKSFVFPHGESQKNMATLNSALEFLAENHLTRTDGIIALGGGVVGDLAGLAAALYLRGIKFIQIPTTLLAAIDSSIGGKTAVDLKAGKNLAGVFYKPSLVLCDTSTLKTLPPETLLDGIAEALKCGVLFDHELFDRVASSNFNEYETSIITDCVEWKRKVVEQDEFEAGTRQLLNLGHTIGHAIEKCSEFTITHGHAVAAGMAIIARSAAASGFCDSDCPRQIEEALSRLGLPSNSTFSAEALAQAALSDKKRRGDKITLVIPKEIGFCILHPLPIDQLTHFIQMGLTKQ